MKHVTCSRCHTVPTKRRRLFLTKDQERVCEDCLANQIASMKWQKSPSTEFSILTWLSANITGVQQEPR